MEKKSYEEYFSGLTPQQQKMLKQGLASTKEWGENEYGFVPEVEKEDGQKKYRNKIAYKIRYFLIHSNLLLLSL